MHKRSRSSSTLHCHLIVPVIKVSWCNHSWSLCHANGWIGSGEPIVWVTQHWSELSEGYLSKTDSISVQTTFLQTSRVLHCSERTFPSDLDKTTAVLGPLKHPAPYLFISRSQERLSRTLTLHDSLGKDLLTPDWSELCIIGSRVPWGGRHFCTSRLCVKSCSCVPRNLSLRASKEPQNFRPSELFCANRTAFRAFSVSHASRPNYRICILILELDALLVRATVEHSRHTFKQVDFSDEAKASSYTILSDTPGSETNGEQTISLLRVCSDLQDWRTIGIPWEPQIFDSARTRFLCENVWRTFVLWVVKVWGTTWELRWETAVKCKKAWR